MRDLLFVLAPGFEDNGRREFCPECAELAGLLAYYPFIRDSLDVRHVGIQHPRAPITRLLGEGRHNAPTLIFAEGSTPPARIATKSANGRIYLDSISAISALFSLRYGIPNRRGDP
ncbi:MAG: DUF3088 family protein [Pseudomonadota bacterium]